MIVKEKERKKRKEKEEKPNGNAINVVTIISKLSPVASKELYVCDFIILLSKTFFQCFTEL